MTLIPLLSVLTLLGDLIIFLLLVVLIFKKQLHGMWDFIRRQSLIASFVVALVALAGSLYFSEILHYDPCRLCWFQRICMYPLVLVFLIALIKKAEDYRKYIIPLSIIGAIIAVYHYYIQFFFVSTTCSPTGESCTASPFILYGYITIPMMALTGFVLIIFLNIFFRKK
jgi:disulfide bond formation protein DsbB